METVVRISGTTSRSSAVHGYLSELGSVPLFSEAELDWIESSEAGPNRPRFDAFLVVRPGYGQPGGPIPAQEESPKEEIRGEEIQ